MAFFNQAVKLIPEDDTERLRELNLKRAVAYARYSHFVWGDASDVVNGAPANRAAARAGPRTRTNPGSRPA